MTVMKTKDDDAPTVDQIEKWRRDELERAGFPDVYADLLAARTDVDLHEACDLLKAGCPWEIAINILT